MTHVPETGNRKNDIGIMLVHVSWTEQNWQMQPSSVQIHTRSYMNLHQNVKQEACTCHKY